MSSFANNQIHAPGVGVLFASPGPPYLMPQEPSHGRSDPRGARERGGERGARPGVFYGCADTMHHL